MSTSTLKYSPLRGAYVDSRGRIRDEKKAIKLPSLKTLDIVSAVILSIAGCFAAYFLLTHTIHMNTTNGVTLIAVTPKNGIAYNFETDPVNPDQPNNPRVVHVVKAHVIDPRATPIK